MKNSFVFCAVILTVLIQSSFAANETLGDEHKKDEQTTNEQSIQRQPRFSRLDDPILLIRPVTKDSSPRMRLPINRKTNPIPMQPLMGNKFLIRAQTDGDDDESLVKEFISHFGHVVTRIDHGNSRKTEHLPPKYISLPPNVNYFIKSIASPQPMKKFSMNSNSAHRHLSQNVPHRPAGFLKKRNINSENLQQMMPQFRASPQIPFIENSKLLKTSSSASDDWTPTPTMTSALMRAIENKQYDHQQLIKSEKEKLVFTHQLTGDYSLPESQSSQTSFSSMIIPVEEDNKILSFKPKVSVRVAADDKLKTRTRLKPVHEFHNDVQDQNSQENIERNVDNDSPSPLFVTPIEVTTKKTTKWYKHRSLVKLNDSCQSTCLMNIVNLEYDPVCGSNDQTYMNVGKFRCTKICGQLQLTIKHFGSCEEKQDIEL